MKYFLRMVLVIFFFSVSFNFIWGQDADLSIPNTNNEVPQSVKILLNQIKTAEDNEDWQLYKSLREQIINELRTSSPELVKLYNTVNIDAANSSNCDDEITGISMENNSVKKMEKKEIVRPMNPIWENDVIFYENRVLTDFSMDVSFNGDIYVSAATKNGSSAADSIYVFKSTDGGLTWYQWTARYTSAGDYHKTEIMCFDGSGEDYVLLFYIYSSGTISQRFNVARYLMSDSTSILPTTIAVSDIVDFAADRNWPASDYRAMVLYDSLSYLKSIRSDPASYGTVWQDKYFIGQVGKDIDLCYGYLGSVYITYNGYSTGNLYVRENLNYGDPTSWSAYTILEDGSTDTTFHSEVIASREAQADINVQILYTKQFGASTDLRRAEKEGAGSWTADLTFITNPNWDIEFPSLYCSKINFNTVFQCSYSMSQLPSLFPRQINQRVYDGSSWLGSQTISDYTPTGLQKSYVAELNGEPIVLYTGSNGTSLYFDNNAWPLPAPAITINPTSLDFGLVTVSEDSMITFNIENTGNADLEITNIASDNSVFTVNLTSTTITPGNNQDIEVTFMPTDVITYNGTIEITHNAVGSPSNVTLTGQGSPAVNVGNDLFSQVPAEYTLLQNFPNPFNPATSIVFGIPESNEVKLTLYSFLGEEITVLYKGYKTAGYHKVEFNAGNLPSGVYFYRIQSGTFVSTKKMILLK